MIKIKDLYDTFLDLISKNSGQFVGIGEFNRYLPMSINELFDDLIGSKTNPKIVYGKNRIVDRRLDGFRVTVNIPVVDNIVTLPTNTEFIRNVIDIKTKIALKPLDEDREGNINSDTLASPNDEDKYYVERNGYLEVLNDDITEVSLSYLKKPTTPVYAVTMQEIRGRERPVYDPVNSIDLVEWNPRETTELLTRMLAKIGLSMRDGFVMQVSNNNKLEE